MKSWLLLFFCLVFASPTVATAQGPSNAQIIAWAKQTRPVWEKLFAESRRKGPRPIPVPPEIDPPCNLCGDDTKTQNELQVDAWVKEAMQPEFGQADQMVDITKQAEIYRNTKGVNDAALSALSYLPDEKYALEAATELLSRYLGERAFPMAEKYDRQPKRAYAGITLLMQATKQYSLLSDLGSENQQAIQYVDAWLESVQAKAENDVLGGKQYNLCPIYMSIIRELELTGANILVTDADLERLKKTLDKMNRMMHFKVEMKLTVHDVNASGTKTDIAWTGAAKMRIKLGNACYTPEWENGNNMSVRVENWSIQGSDGTPVELVSARNFQAPLKPPLLNLCEPNPVLQVPFDVRNIPFETISVKGHTAPNAAYFRGMLAGVIGSNNAGPKGSELTGRSDKGPATLNRQDPDEAQNQTDAMKELQAHQNDRSWFLSAEGQAVIKKVQQQALARSRGQVSQMNNAAANAHNVQDVMASLLAAQMHWKNGDVDVAGDNWHVTKDGARISLEMKVTNEPQK